LEHLLDNSDNIKDLGVDLDLVDGVWEDIVVVKAILGKLFEYIDLQLCLSFFIVLIIQIHPNQIASNPKDNWAYQSPLSTSCKNNKATTRSSIYQASHYSKFHKFRILLSLHH